MSAAGGYSLHVHQDEVFLPEVPVLAALATHIHIIGYVPVPVPALQEALRQAKTGAQPDRKGLTLGSSTGACYPSGNESDDRSEHDH